MVAFLAAANELGPYVRAVSSWKAGAIELCPYEDASMVQLMLLRAASILGERVRSEWAAERVLHWVKLDAR